MAGLYRIPAVGACGVVFRRFGRRDFVSAAVRARTADLVVDGDERLNGVKLARRSEYRLIGVLVRF